MKFRTLLLFLICSLKAVSGLAVGVVSLSLDGKWQMGFSRKYTTTVMVPGIPNDPAKIMDEELWYKKEVKLPAGNWTTVTLELKGARFKPQVFINGEMVSQHEGGMAPIFFELKHKDLKPGNTVTLEIALASLKNTPQTDASYVPGADHFRNDVSSGLWDDVVLHFHGDVSVERIIPFIDYKKQSISVQFDLHNADNFNGKASIKIFGGDGKPLLTATQPVIGSHSAVDFNINGKLKGWSPEHPNLYHLKLILVDANGQVTDVQTIPFGVKQVSVIDKQFYLNGQHFVAKGATVVWHRWMRTTEGRELGYDTAWFKKNIIKRSKDLGGNYLRFHLGLPPERLLDLCDQYGLAVQYEWSFFHGMPASKESLLIQYKSWLDLAMRHPCVSFIHPYNETGGDQLKTVWAALDELLPHYPPLLIEDRDVMHVHKYWWSLFENLGLYYDNANVFPKAVMADEFGGNYLDQNGDPGLYSTVKETFLRFLGRNHTKEDRLYFHAQANAKVAEYWRRIGAAGFSPFCALGSNEDGNNWFLGPLKEGNPKPVWAALAAAFSPRSVSIELWDKDFAPSQKLDLPVYLFNDDEHKADLKVQLKIEDKAGKVFFTKIFTSTVNAFDKVIEKVAVELPSNTGDYFIKAELLNKPAEVKYPVISEWNIRVVKAEVPPNLKNLKVAIPDDEIELKQFLADKNIAAVSLSDNSANLILTSLKTWNKLAKGNSGLSLALQTAITNGVSVIMLDVGDRQLGQGYPTHAGDLGPLQSVVRISEPKVNTYSLFAGISLKFTETAEPESYIHPDKLNNDMWNNLPEPYTGIWNGLRGGLIVPAADMEFSGMSASAYVSQWKARGANSDKIIAGPYYAYELQGFYDFSDKPDDADVQKKLKARLNFLIQDAPSLAGSLNPLAPIAITDLLKGYNDAKKGVADNFIPLANCAKNLTQTPVALIGFGPGKGALVVSQLLTAGRLATGFGETGLYGIRYDEVAGQYVLNMMSEAVKKSGK